MNIFFDLDGTLIDSKRRLYNLFQFLVPDSKLTYTEYWRLKKQEINHKTILLNNLNFSNDEIEKFELKWMELIENDDWLILDKPFKNVTKKLKKLKFKNQLILVTARQYPIKVYDQITRFGWQSIFNHIFVTEQKKEKIKLILEKKNLNIQTSDIFIGDTGKDILTGKALGIKTVAVLSGFLNEKSLKKYNPDCIIKNINQLKLKT
jgi:phosphoglycolate phosphatase